MGALTSFAFYYLNRTNTVNGLMNKIEVRKYVTHRIFNAKW